MKCKVCGLEYSTAGGKEHLGCPGKPMQKQGEKPTIGRLKDKGERAFKKGFEGQK